MCPTSSDKLEPRLVGATSEETPDSDLVSGLVSVVIPTYNYGRFLRDSVGSVLEQSHESVEVLVVDDGSSDETEEVATSLAEQDPRVIYIPKANGGVSQARNVGIERATGQFLSFLDADDAYAPGRIQRHVATLQERTDVDFVYGDESASEENLEIVSTKSKANLPLPPDRLVHYISTFAPYNPTLRTKFVRSVGGFDESMRYSEDWDFWFRATKSGKTLYVPGLTGTYRHHSNQTIKAWENLLASRDTVVQRYLSPLTLERFDAWSFTQWHRAKGYWSHGKVLKTAIALAKIAPQLVIPGRVGKLERLFYA
jgi:glycosyltransferase involved in cell wall biosynthesis